MTSRVSKDRHASHPLLAAGVLLAAGLAAAALFFLDPARGGIFPPCPFHALTGYLCPGCGTLRALHCLLHGRLAAAWHLNPLAVLALPYVGYESAASALRATTRRRVPSIFVPSAVIWALLAVIMAYWVLRNVPHFPIF